MSNTLARVFALAIYSLIPILAFYLLARILIFLVNVDGQSMYPTLKDCDRVLALRHWPARWLYCVRSGRAGQLCFDTPWLENHPERDGTGAIGADRYGIRSSMRLPGRGDRDVLRFLINSTSGRINLWEPSWSSARYCFG
jgi:hypothetical protein